MLDMQSFIACATVLLEKGPAVQLADLSLPDPTYSFLVQTPDKGRRLSWFDVSAHSIYGGQCKLSGLPELYWTNTWSRIRRIQQFDLPFVHLLQLQRIFKHRS